MIIVNVRRSFNKAAYVLFSSICEKYDIMAAVMETGEVMAQYVQRFDDIFKSGTQKEQRDADKITSI